MKKASNKKNGRLTHDTFTVRMMFGVCLSYFLFLFFCHGGRLFGYYIKPLIILNSTFFKLYQNYTQIFSFIVNTDFVSAELCY